MQLSPSSGSNSEFLIFFIRQLFLNYCQIIHIIFTEDRVPEIFANFPQIRYVFCAKFRRRIKIFTKNKAALETCSHILQSVLIKDALCLKLRTAWAIFIAFQT